MKKFQFNDMKGGWFIGNFEPTAFKTSEFEVAVISHKQGEMWDKHYHKKSKEITLVLKGKIKLDDEILSKGDIFLIEPDETVDPEFLEDTEVIVIKTPSITNDKYIIER
jgi:quercetin dioxygenase-like cupin family protein